MLYKWNPTGRSLWRLTFLTQRNAVEIHPKNKHYGYSCSPSPPLCLGPLLLRRILVRIHKSPCMGVHRRFLLSSHNSTTSQEFGMVQDKFSSATAMAPACILAGYNSPTQTDSGPSRKEGPRQIPQVKGVYSPRGDGRGDGPRLKGTMVAEAEQSSLSTQQTSAPHCKSQCPWKAGPT